MCNKVGSDPFIVLADADLDAAATRAVKARYIKVGLSCVNAKRFIVEESGADRFVALFVEKAAALKIGDPMERGHQHRPDGARQPSGGLGGAIDECPI
ncbi:aldehyde dehydrogenase family protein [Paracoccus yeei]|uniref:aldehyde dehydrogenase family protein n=1 Tax=Paracoccus yeei TaxID=147645 RepID=UPI001C8EDBB6|nr:aldehyde dehydrogenase family protein [Paracoccus yeei]